VRSSGSAGRFSGGITSYRVPPRTDEKSNSRRRGCWASAWITAGHAPITVARSRDRNASVRSRSNPSSASSVAPRSMQPSRETPSPPTQKNGIEEYTRSPSTMSWYWPTFTEWRTSVPWVCKAPFGSAVLPEV
jgi:hypothetical protein